MNTDILEQKWVLRAVRTINRAVADWNASREADEQLRIAWGFRDKGSFEAENSNNHHPEQHALADYRGTRFLFRLWLDDDDLVTSLIVHLHDGIRLPADRTLSGLMDTHAEFCESCDDDGSFRGVFNGLSVQEVGDSDSGSAEIDILACIPVRGESRSRFSVSHLVTTLEKIKSCGDSFREELSGGS